MVRPKWACDKRHNSVANTVKTVTSLLEPLIITVLGSAIGGIAIAMLLPIFKLSSPVR